VLSLTAGVRDADIATNRPSARQKTNMSTSRRQRADTASSFALRKRPFGGRLPCRILFSNARPRGSIFKLFFFCAYLSYLFLYFSSSSAVQIYYDMTANVTATNCIRSLGRWLFFKRASCLFLQLANFVLLLKTGRLLCEDPFRARE
jgi:hypothetical protein